jgi:hypothetical protein
MRKTLADPGPFRWCLIELSQRNDVGETPARSDGALLVQGRRTHTSPTFLLRPQQLPRTPVRGGASNERQARALTGASDAHMIDLLASYQELLKVAATAREGTGGCQCRRSALGGSDHGDT